MNKIAVTGGKGGTGKTTFAILLAFKYSSLKKKVLLVDCDVECPNIYILLGINNLKKPIERTFTYYPVIDKKKCTKCGLCARKCLSNAILSLADDYPKIEKELCSSCRVCWTICPEKAIKKKKEQNGEIYKSIINKNITLVTGISKPGVRETSPVVKDTKKYVETIKRKFDVIIYDTAAGSHCTVIAALDGADKAYAVTEPTPLGAHDLNVILQVLKVIQIPSEVVINQFDMGNTDLISEIVRENNVSITQKIPYNKSLAQLYSKGKLLEDPSLFHLLQKI